MIAKHAVDFPAGTEWVWQGGETGISFASNSVSKPAAPVWTGTGGVSRKPYVVRQSNGRRLITTSLSGKR